MGKVRGRTAGGEAVNAGPGRPRDKGRTDAILRVAYEQLRAHGVDGVTSAGLAQAAGVSTATLYRRWPSKEALLMDAYLVAVEERISSSAGKAGARLPALERLRRQLTSSAQAFSGAEGDVMISLVRCAQASSDVQNAFLDRLIRPRRVADIALVEACVREGSIREDIDADVLLDGLYGPLYFRLFVALKPIRRADILRHFDLMLEGAAPA